MHKRLQRWRARKEQSRAREDEEQCRARDVRGRDNPGGRDTPGGRTSSRQKHGELATHQDSGREWRELRALPTGSAWYRSGAMMLLLVVAAAVAVAGCDSSGEDVLAPYEASRPLVLQKVTQSFTPDIQWVGGRVAAVGVNRGSRAALDSTLVWIVRDDDDVIGSHVTVGRDGDEAFVESLGGEALEMLENGEEYTFWLAEQSAFAVGLDSAEVDSFTFADTTVTMQLVLRGASGGDRELDPDVRVVRDESLLGMRYTLDWTPAVPVTQIGIRAASTGGFNNLIYHVVAEESSEGILPPVVIGEEIPGTLEAIAFQDFSPNVHTLWMTTEHWNESFAIGAPGYMWLRMIRTNFE